MRNRPNIPLPRSPAAMAGAVVASLFVPGPTTVSGPIAFTLAAAPIA